MKKIFRFAATLTGAFALVTGFTACSKDEDGDHGECCTYSYSGFDEYGKTYSYSYTACEDGTYFYTDSNGGSGVTNWKDAGYFDSWDEAKSYMQSYSEGVKCS